MVAGAVGAAGLDQRVGALDVGAQEGLRVRDGVVVVGFRGVVHDGIVGRGEVVHEVAVANVAHDEFHAVGGQARDVLAVAGVGELVEHGHLHTGVLVHHVVDEVGADEAAPAGDDDGLGLEGLVGHT